MSLKDVETTLAICSALAASANYNAERRKIKYEKPTSTKADPYKKAKRKAKQRAQRINRGKK